MINDTPEHIDQVFKDQYEQIEVRYNAAHWTQLQGALAAATAAGLASNVPTSNWSRIAKILKANKLITFLTALAIPAVLFILLRDPSSQQPPPIHSKQNNHNPKETPAVVIAEDTFLFHGTDSVKLYKKGKLFEPDTLIKPIILAVDSLDSLKADTTKKDIFIFW